MTDDAVERASPGSAGPAVRDDATCRRRAARMFTLALAVSLAALAGCKRAPVQETLAPLPQFARLAESWLIDAGDPAARRFFVTGWSADEAWGDGGFTFLWATGRVSTIRVNRFGETDVVLRFRCAPNHAPELGGQTITTLVNGHEVAATELRAGFATYEISIPSSALNPGINTLEFRYRYAMPPPIPGSTDQRELAVAWDWLEFLETRAKPNQRTARLSNGALTMPYRSAVRFPIRLDTDLAFAADAIEVDGYVEDGDGGMLLVNLVAPDETAIASQRQQAGDRDIRFVFPGGMRGAAVLELIAIPPRDGAPASALGLTIRDGRLARRTSP